MSRRITLNLPDALIDAAEHAVATGRARSLSAYIAAAAGAGEARTTLDDVLTRWAATAQPPAPGAPDPDGWARQVLARADSRHAQPAAGTDAA